MAYTLWGHSETSLSFHCLELKKLADEVQNKEYSVSRVSNDVPRQQVLKSPEWQTLKVGFIRYLIFLSFVIEVIDFDDRYWRQDVLLTR